MEKTITVKLQIEETEYTAPSQWRLIGAKAKTLNAAVLCKRFGITPARVLEVGAGDGSILRWLDGMNFCQELHALEISPSGVEVINSLGISRLKNAVLFDGYNIPYPDNAFDLVILAHVLEHVEFERVLLRELARVARYQVIEVPLDLHPRTDVLWMQLASYGHINVYTPMQLRFLLRTEGFRIIGDRSSIHDLDTEEYSHFENNGRPRTEEAVARFRAEFAKRNEEFQSLPTALQEARAHSYTVLTEKADSIYLLNEHLQAAYAYREAGEKGNARLILSYLLRCGVVADAAQLPIWAQELLAQ